MAMRRLHWHNSIVGELLYLLNVYKVRQQGQAEAVSMRVT